MCGSNRRLTTPPLGEGWGHHSCLTPDPRDKRILYCPTHVFSAQLYCPTHGISQRFSLKKCDVPNLPRGGGGQPPIWTTHNILHSISAGQELQKANATLTITAGVIVIRIPILSRSRDKRRFMAVYTFRRVGWINIKQLVHFYSTNNALL